MEHFNANSRNWTKKLSEKNKKQIQKRKFIDKAPIKRVCKYARFSVLFMLFHFYYSYFISTSTMFYN